MSLAKLFSFNLPVIYLSLFHTLSTNVRPVAAVDLDIDDVDSIKAAAKTIAYGAMTYYHGNETGQIPGLLPQPWYWWEAGALFGQLIEYAYYTGDETYNDIVTQGLLFQTGPEENYMPPNQSKNEGNDDQAFWAFAAMTACELKYPDPPEGSPSWLALAQAVFNTQIVRWDNATCGGGFRWQIYPTNNGYDYKNSISNGGFFQLAARLARYTGNQSYADWATKSFDWSVNSPLFGRNWQINDGTSTGNNCSDASQLQWTYNYATYILGAAYMYNFTNGDALWGNRLSGMLNGTNVFYVGANKNILSEVACEPTQSCNNDQPSFKSYMTRWLAMTMQLAPFTAPVITPRLRAAAIGAAGQCIGGTDGVTCGRRWYQSTWDGEYGIGEQMSALGALVSNIMQLKAAPVTANTGGTSKGDPNAGTGDGSNPIIHAAVTTADKAGAGILTALVLISLLGGAWWMIS